MLALEIQEENHFLQEVFTESGVDIQRCYKCQKCSAGCPVASEMDILPHQLIHQIRCGMRNKVLCSKSIWICVSCNTCSVRCPNNIDLAGVVDSLRHIAIRSGLNAGEKDIPVFHRAFLDGIKNKGRIHELSLVLHLKLKTKKFLDDAGLGWQMFRRGKIKVLRPSSIGAKELKEIFNTCKKRVVI